ncbi:hypothetical protein, partial [Brucella daejeonensis]|uniref:hypothetical protein n=1 Tax=Brucella daejeonensis TaxID=659015 RepID=UPI001AED2055
QPKVNRFHQNSRTKQPAASSVAALVVAPYRPHQSKLSTQFFKKSGFFFPQTIWSFLTGFQPPGIVDSNECDSLMTVAPSLPALPRPLYEAHALYYRR